MSEYLSASEFSTKYGLHKAVTIRLLSAGRIPGAIKIGNQWAIPTDTPKPEDRRVKSGKYKGWRKQLDSE